MIADVCFKGGYIDSWGSGTLKIISTCKEAALPDPEIIEQDGGILVTVFKNKYSADQLQKLGLNERQVIKGGTFQNYKDKAYLKLTDKEIAKHLNGEQLIGIYPLLSDKSSWFLVADFDKEN